MNLIGKNFIAISLISAVVGIFAFHWFFIADTGMPVTECFSIDCIYSSPKAVIQESRDILISMAVLLAEFSLFFAARASFTNFGDALTKASAILCSSSIFKKRPDTFYYKFNSWLKILQKRDPYAELISARISDFRQ
ncbi:MAG: hypothetical protein HYT36_01960 [Candidatus Staskawiczbacteria bacterium]|nr:hypothetical protein [Candidatus Staskawiczbacteria bacterium]